MNHEQDTTPAVETIAPRKHRKWARALLLAVAFLFALGAAAVAGLLFALKHEVEGAFFDSNGVPIHYTVQGEGPPVILIHGFAVNADVNWRLPGTVAALAREFKVIAMDVRGHGRSGKPRDPSKYGMELVEDVVRLMDHLGLPKAHVAGYSMGGFITMKLLTTHPDRLFSAAPCGAGWMPPGGDTEKLLTQIATSMNKNRGVRVVFHRLVRGWRHPLDTLGVVVEKALEDFLNDEEALTALGEKFPALSVLEDALRANQIPVLSIVGGDDSLKNGVDEMTGILANHTVLVLDGANHTSAVFRRELKIGLRDFFRRYSPAQ